jgi:hypothetical protein
VKREFLLFITVLIVAASAAYVLFFGFPAGDGHVRPLACYMNGGSTMGACR